VSLAGRVALVTGSSRGIGEAVAHAFAAARATVVVNSATDAAGGEHVAQRILAAGGTAGYVQADVRHPDEVDRLFSTIERTYGPVEVLVNNAGRTDSAPPLEATPQHWTDMLHSNLMSAAFCAQRASTTMLTVGGGTIINTSSIRSTHGRSAAMAYSAAKAALDSLTRVLAAELAPAIRVNAVAPGFVATSYLDRVDEALKREWLGSIPLGRFITVEKIAQAYLFLAQAPYLTGTILTADAGFTLPRR
jgi:3-oxoacyl-[acyl-carrier protein] reductase